MPGACLHRGVWLDGLNVFWVLLLLLLLREFKSFGISSLRDTSLHSRFRAQDSTTDLGVDHPSCTSLNKGHLTISRGGIVHTNELAAVLGVPSIPGDQKGAEKGEVFEESPCYQMLHLQTFGKIFCKEMERGADFKN